MTAQLVGLTANSLLKSGDKLRATWTFWGSSWLPAALHDAPAKAVKVREQLPSLGFIPISQPSAVDGDEVIVFDVQLSQSWGSGVAASTVVASLDDLGFGFYDLVLTRLEKIVATSSTDLQQQQAAAVQQGNADANANVVFDKLGATLGIAGKTLALAVVVAAGVAAYLLLRRK